MRGPWSLYAVMRPNVGDVNVLDGASGLAWLKALKNSERNCSLRCSAPSGKSRTAEKSAFQKPGARRTLRPMFPNEPRAGNANAALLNQASRLGLTRRGLPTRSTNPLLPVSEVSVFELITMGSPVCAAKTPEVDQWAVRYSAARRQPLTPGVA